ncbi:hypothetical protein KY290_032091 [Solanum tuberosum]|uniref:Uncharacterized protein n=1 Tax=Solanum tuberosum TaxID=4113 RepID=A0ABQ7UCA0_SOLTU|nr:hypothetical protein KY290_032091 [Solanum tuberosum]
MTTEEAYDDTDLKWPNYFQIRNCREEQFNHLWETSGVKPMDGMILHLSNVKHLQNHSGRDTLCYPKL